MTITEENNGTAESQLSQSITHISTLWAQWEEYGIGPDARSVRNMAAVGMVETVWRNSPLEYMHEGGGRRGLGPSDGEMFAESVSLQRRAYAALEPFTYRYIRGNDPSRQERVSKPELSYSRITAFEDHVLDTKRPWAAGGRTLQEMGWGYIGEFRKHVKRHLDVLLHIDRHYGYRAALGALIAVTDAGGGLGSGGDHYGTPAWPSVAAAARTVILTPESYDIAPSPPGTPPPDELYRALLDSPDKLPVAVLDWLAYNVMYPARSLARR